MKMLMALAALVLVAAPVIAVTTIDLRPAGGDEYYLNDDNTVWRETNGHEGLDTAPFCLKGVKDGDNCLDAEGKIIGKVIPADENVL